MTLALGGCSEDVASGVGSGAPISHAGNAPGRTGNTPGQSGQTPGQGGTAPPGQGGTTPGQGGMHGMGGCTGASCDDGNPCTADACAPGAGCTHANVPDGTLASSAPTSCGVGACRAAGQSVCSGGAVVDTCAPGSPAASDATCDGVDDDCDGTADEDYAPTTTSCGVGACAATGTTSCVAGAVVNSCTAGASSGGSDTVCNGVDDDCDGAVDEDFAPAATSCGVGACQRAGVTACAGGVVTDSCAAGGAASSDASCNGVDDDCDGRVDEEYAPTPTFCGVGACLRGGSTSCVAGAVVDGCAAGAPASSDATCDGVDDDCNGAVDEDFAPTATSCGVGACAATGTTACVGGAVTNSCTAGGAASSDATCDGVDDDCDGAVDEDYAPAPTTCGTGACARTGATSCAGGAVRDSCVPGPGPCEAPTVIFTTTPPATTSNTRADFVWTYGGGYPSSIRYTTSNGYDSGVTTPLNTGFSYLDLRPGTYTLTVTATNAAGTGTASYTRTVTAPPVGGARVVGGSYYAGLQTVGLDGATTALGVTDAQIAQWSPDGRLIAYRRTYPSELWVMRADGTSRLNLSAATGGVAVGHFAWSHDSSKLVFDVVASGYTDLWAVNADGTGLRNLTGTASASEDDATFTPSGRVVYRNVADSWALWTMNADGTGKARLVAAGADVVLGRPLFSPDGAFLYATNFRGELLRFNAAGGGRAMISGGAVSFVEYSLSPDGHRVAFLRNNQVWVIDNADGAATVRQLSTQSSGLHSAYQITTWSPDGASVVFDCNTSTGDGSRLCRVDANAPAPVAATSLGSGQFQFPHFSGYNPARGN